MKTALVIKYSACNKTMWMLSVILCLAFGVATKMEEQPKCEQMNIEQCRNVGYNVTGIPNIFGDTSQVDIELKLMEINILLTASCAEPVRFFFCSMYAPMCSTKSKSLITSCRPLCEYVTEQCRPTAERFGLVWLQSWNCSQFYWSNNEHEMCMPGPSYNFTTIQQLPTISTGTQPNKEKPLKNNNNYIYVERLNSFVLLCSKDGIFTTESRQFTESWMAVWAIVCFISTSIALLTFLVDIQRFRYPERSIVMLAFCYNIYSIGYIIRLILGREAVSCVEDDTEVPYVTKDELSNPVCAFVFFILYFFGMAANIWWVILTLTWFLSAGMRWGCDAISSYSYLFHLVAWLLPGVKTVLVLIFRKVDGDELTGLCYVGNQDSLALTGFVLGPQFTFLIIGTLFLVAGFLALYRIRLSIRKEGLAKIDKLDRFILRIGIFSVFSALPITCVIAVQFYEYNNRENWRYGRTQPNINVLMLKICMSVFVGVMSGIWMWTPKTCVSWRNFYQRKVLRQSLVQNRSNNNFALRNEVTVPTHAFHDESEV